MSSDARPDDGIRVRVSLGLVGINLSLAALSGLWALRRRRAASRPCARATLIGASLAFVALAVVEVTVPLVVVEPDRVRRNHRVFQRRMRIDGIDDLVVGTRGLRRRSDGRLIETTVGARRSDVERLSELVSGRATAAEPVTRRRVPW